MFKFIPFDAKIDRQKFSCSPPEGFQDPQRQENANAITNYFRNMLSQDMRSGMYTCYFAMHGDDVAGFYLALPGSVALDRLPDEVRVKKFRFLDCGVLLLAKMGVDYRFAGHELGSKMIIRAAMAARLPYGITFPLVLVRAKPGVDEFYKKNDFVSILPESGVPESKDLVLDIRSIDLETAVEYFKH